MRLLLTAILSLGLTATALIAPAAAQTARVGQAQVYHSILPSEMATLLNGSDYASVTKTTDKTFDIETREGFRFSVEMAACDVENETPGCFGVIFFSSWTLEAADRAKLTTVVEKFNSDYRIGKAFLTSDRVYAERYITTDGGVTQDHIGEEASTFLSMMGQLNEILNAATAP